ncbi:MAG TPA: lysozyme [Rhodospirillaceae bacterium]|nr:lysozyme [Magnetovibrio sp.]HCS70073.1 lysozyme [Rhodospirillaceae bacterium]|tara:strand:- start:273 stop:794 length:522 start_codon:yes stop_codon:yes gene_type:complete
MSAARYRSGMDEQPTDPAPMAPDSRFRLILAKRLENHEGRVRHAYEDSEGYLTIGVGHLIDKRLGGGLPDPIIDALLQHDIAQVYADLDRNLPDWIALPAGPQMALAEMCFQLGWPRLSGFKKMLAAVAAHDFQTAHDEALDSKWADQTPGRAREVAALFLKTEDDFHADIPA